MSIRDDLDALRKKKSNMKIELEALRGKSQATPEEPAYERNWYDAPRAALQGMTMGISDELGAGAGALAVKVFNDDDTELSEIYNQMKSRINQERKAYEDANPGEALALNLAGGLATGGASANKLMASKLYNNASKLKKASLLTALSGTEGTFTGAASADEGKRGEGALLGGSIGTALPLALSGGKTVIDTIAKRRIQPEMLDTAGNFLPINQVADEGSTLGNIYQKIVAPSFGGQKLREQNRGVLNRATKALDESKATKEALKTTGKQADDAALRNQVKMDSLPDNVSEEFKSKILQSDGHEAIKNIDQAWNQGFKVVKDKTFNINPKGLVDDVLADLDSPMDSEFSGKIASTIRNKLKGGFTPTKVEPEVKYLSKGMGSQKAPKVELESGQIDGAWLMQARNSLRMKADDLADEGATALEVNALKSSARKIDDLIRANLDEADNAIFDKELKSWGNYQLGKRGTIAAGITQQGLYEPQQLLQAGRTNQKRNFGKGDAPFQKEAQDLQVQSKSMMDRANKQIELDEAALNDVKGKLPNLNPDPWTKGVATGTLGAAPLSVIPGMSTKLARDIMMPFGYGIGKVASTEGAQKTIAGQTEIQKTIAELLRQYQGSGLQKGLQAGQGALSRQAIMEMTEE